MAQGPIHHNDPRELAGARMLQRQVIDKLEVARNRLNRQVHNSRGPDKAKEIQKLIEELERIYERMI